MYRQWLEEKRRQKGRWRFLRVMPRGRYAQRRVTSVRGFGPTMGAQDIFRTGFRALRRCEKIKSEQGVAAENP